MDFPYIQNMDTNTQVNKTANDLKPSWVISSFVFIVFIALQSGNFVRLMKPESYLVCNWNACENVSRLMQLQIEIHCRCLWLEFANARLVAIVSIDFEFNSRCSLKPYQPTCPPLSVLLPPCTATPSSMISQLAKLRNLIIFFSFFFWPL